MLCYMLRIIIIKIVCKILYVYLVIRLYKRIWWVLELSVFSEWDLGTGVEQKLFFTPVCYSKTQFVWFHQCPKNTFFCHCSSILRVCRLDCLDHLDYRLPSKYFCHTTKSGSPEIGASAKNWRRREWWDASAHPILFSPQFSGPDFALLRTAGQD